MHTSILTVRPDQDAVARREQRLNELKAQYGNKLLCHSEYKTNPKHRLPGYPKSRRSK